MTREHDDITPSFCEDTSEKQMEDSKGARYARRNRKQTEKGEKFTQEKGKQKPRSRSGKENTTESVINCSNCKVELESNKPSTSCCICGEGLHINCAQEARDKQYCTGCISKIKWDEIEEIDPPFSTPCQQPPPKVIRSPHNRKEDQAATELIMMETSIIEEEISALHNQLKLLKSVDHSKESTENEPLLEITTPTNKSYCNQNKSTNKNSLIGGTKEVNYKLNMEAALAKKLKACDRVAYESEIKNGCGVITLSTAGFEIFKGKVLSYLEHKPEYSMTVEFLRDKCGNITQDIVRVKKAQDGREQSEMDALFTINMYRTTGRIMINGPSYRRFTDWDLPVIEMDFAAAEEEICYVNNCIKECINQTNSMEYTSNSCHTDENPTRPCGENDICLSRKHTEIDTDERKSQVDDSLKNLGADKETGDCKTPCTGKSDGDCLNDHGGTCVSDEAVIQPKEREVMDKEGEILDESAETLKHEYLLMNQRMEVSEKMEETIGEVRKITNEGLGNNQEKAEELQKVLEPNMEEIVAEKTNDIPRFNKDKQLETAVKQSSTNKMAEDNTNKGPGAPHDDEEEILSYKPKVSEDKGCQKEHAEDSNLEGWEIVEPEENEPKIVEFKELEENDPQGQKIVDSEEDALPGRNSVVGLGLTAERAQLDNKSIAHSLSHKAEVLGTGQVEGTVPVVNKYSLMLSKLQDLSGESTAEDDLSTSDSETEMVEDVASCSSSDEENTEKRDLLSINNACPILPEESVIVVPKEVSEEIQKDGCPKKIELGDTSEMPYSSPKAIPPANEGNYFTENTETKQLHCKLCQFVSKTVGGIKTHISKTHKIQKSLIYTSKIACCKCKKEIKQAKIAEAGQCVECKGMEHYRCNMTNKKYLKQFKDGSMPFKCTSCCLPGVFVPKLDMRSTVAEVKCPSIKTNDKPLESRDNSNRGDKAMIKSKQMDLEVGKKNEIQELQKDNILLTANLRNYMDRDAQADIRVKLLTADNKEFSSKIQELQEEINISQLRESKLNFEKTELLDKYHTTVKELNSLKFELEKTKDVAQGVQTVMTKAIREANMLSLEKDKEIERLEKENEKWKAENRTYKELLSPDARYQRANLHETLNKEEEHPQETPNKMSDISSLNGDTQGDDQDKEESTPDNHSKIHSTGREGMRDVSPSKSDKVRYCHFYNRNGCTAPNCQFLHDVAPTCKKFLEGKCRRRFCMYRHEKNHQDSISKASSGNERNEIADNHAFNRSGIDRTINPSKYRSDSINSGGENRQPRDDCSDHRDDDRTTFSDTIRRKYCHFYN